MATLDVIESSVCFDEVELFKIRKTHWQASIDAPAFKATFYSTGKLLTFEHKDVIINYDQNRDTYLVEWTDGLSRNVRSPNQVISELLFKYKQANIDNMFRSETPKLIKGYQRRGRRIQEFEALLDILNHWPC